MIPDSNYPKATERELENCHVNFEVPINKFVISKSLSHSNIPKPETSSMTPRRCSSVPPIIRMGYYKQISPFDICGGVLSTDKVFSLSLSALTCDPIKNATTKKRSCSVPPTFRYENSDKNYQMLEALRNSNQLDSDVSYDRDYSGPTVIKRTILQSLITYHVILMGVCLKMNPPLHLAYIMAILTKEENANVTVTLITGRKIKIRSFVCKGKNTLVTQSQGI